VVCPAGPIGGDNYTDVLEQLELAVNVWPALSLSLATSVIPTTDDYCPVISWLITDNATIPVSDAVENSTDYFFISEVNGEDALMFDVSIPLATTTFYVLGQTAAGYRYQEFEVNITCQEESQNITTDGSADLIFVLKNEDVVDLITDADLLAYFTINETALCPITSIQVYTEEEDAAIVDGDDYYTLFDLANRATDLATLQVSTTIGTPEEVGSILDLSYNFTLLATAEGGATVFKSVTVTIDICGYEELTLVTNGTLDEEVFINPSANSTEIDMAALFQSNDTYCPPLTYLLFTTNDTD
jgi:hypothetical protein